MLCDLGASGCPSLGRLDATRMSGTEHVPGSRGWVCTHFPLVRFLWSTWSFPRSTAEICPHTILLLGEDTEGGSLE